VINELGRFALEKAGALLADIDREHPDIELRSISVNLSVAQLAQGDIVDDVRRTLQQNGLEGKRLLLEVTETAIMDNGPQAAAIFASLRELGVRLCIDDFGTGYSSLRYLNEFPFDVLKIDRSFVRGTSGRLANEPIVTMLMRLAESLKVTVIAEGIETEEQRIRLRDGGCRFGQGFLFAQALSEAEIVPWLEAAAQHKARRPRLRIAP
jgi:EAL domain-containing protein (putative c-di-GMP-specific phosphodiesterase class I)